MRNHRGPGLTRFDRAVQSPRTQATDPTGHCDITLRGFEATGADAGSETRLAVRLLLNGTRPSGWNGWWPGCP